MVSEKAIQGIALAIILISFAIIVLQFTGGELPPWPKPKPTPTPPPVNPTPTPTTPPAQPTPTPTTPPSEGSALYVGTEFESDEGYVP